MATAPFSYPATVEMRSYNPVRRGHGGQIRKAAQLLLAAKRPYIYTGGGVVIGNASAELRALVDLLGFPCTNTLMGLGAYPASDPKFLGMLGMHGTYEANMTMQNCDVLLAVGARFDDRVIGNPKHFASVERKIIHVDIDPSSISKRVKVDIPIVGDVKEVLIELAAQIRESASKPDVKALSPWWAQINEWRKRDCLAYPKGGDVIKPQHVVETLWELTKDKETYITSDVGQHQMWAAQYYRFEEPRRWINSGGLGTMGVGLPYAMGIKLAKPDAEVVCITGEGSIQMCIQELSTCLQYKTPVKIVSLNNRYLGMVRQWQQIDYGGALLAQLHGRAARLREAGRGLRPRRHPDRQAERGRAGAARGAAPEGPDRVPRRPAPTRPRTSGRWSRPARASPRCCSARRTCEAHHRSPPRERGRRAVARGRPVLGARLQHRDPDRRADRGSRRSRA